VRAALAGYDAVVDATHPFATGMTANAAAACTDVPLLRLKRPGWPADPAETRVTLCDLGVFADQPAEPVQAQNPEAGAESWRPRPSRRRGCSRRGPACSLWWR
jgi:hypothetical protein